MQQLLLKCLQAQTHPMAVPGVFAVFIQLEGVAQIFQYTQIVQRVNFAGDGLRQRPDSGAPGRIGRQQGGRGAGFFQVFDDGQRLGQTQSIDLQHRDQGVTVEAGEAVLELLTLGQMHRHVVVRQTFERQGDTHPEGRG